MAYSGVRELIIENPHNGERLAMRRVQRGDEVWRYRVDSRVRMAIAAVVRFSTCSL